MHASHDLAEMVRESLCHSASHVKEILRSHPFRFNLGVHLVFSLSWHVAPQVR